jgi:S1-C subfamily serine protease
MAGAISGFRRGDLIIEFNHTKISNFDALLKVVLKTKPDQRSESSGNGETKWPHS